MPSGYPTTPSGLNAAANKQNAALSDAKAGSAKGTSGVYSDRPNAPVAGKAGIPSRFINKPASPKPSGSTSDTGREKS